MFYGLLLKAQNSPYRFKTLTVNDGLSQNSIWQLLRDKDGFLWVGTADGLNRYDGYEVKNYKHNFNDSTSIGGNNITFLFQDKYGHIWIGTEAGVDVYDPVKNNFIHPIAFPIISPANLRSHFFFDEPNGEHLWLYSYNTGIVRYNTRNCKLTENVPFLNTFKIKDQRAIMNAHREGNTGYVMFENGKIVAYDFNTQLHKLIQLHQKNSFDFKVHQGNIYYVKDYFFQSYNLSNGNIKKLASLPQITTCTVISLVQNNWIITSELGYAFVDTLTCNVKYYASFDPTKEQTYNRISSFLYDKQGMLWFGTDGKGLYYTSAFANKFSTYQSKLDEENMVKGICTMPDNKMVAAIYNQGLLVYDVENFKFKKIAGTSAFPKATSKQFAAVCAANQNEVWVSNTQDGDCGLFLVNTKTGKGTNYSHLISKHHSIKTQASYFSFLYKQNEKLYAVSFDLLVEVYKEGNGYNSKLVYKDDSITNTCLYISKDKKYIINGYANGTSVRKLNDKNFRLKLKQKGQELTKCINQDQDSNFYVATTSGIYVYNKNFGLITHYTTSNGLADNFVYGILCGDDSNMWFSHNKGISCFFVKNKTFKHYNVSDGLQSNEFNTGAFHKAANGQMFFGGVNGINGFYPQKIKDNPNKPQVYISNIKLFDEPYKSDTAYWLKRNILLPYFQNTLSFEFVAPEMANAARNQYAYKLEGIDENWIYNDNKRFARYPNLPHGEYVLKIKAANSDGIWNEIPATLHLNITPPFWKTTWFYFLTFLLLLASVCGVVFYFIRSQRIKLKRELDIQIKLETERLRISRDLHDNVGAQLSYLITNIDWMLQHPDEITEQETKIRLASLGDTGKQAIITLRQTIWALNNKELSIEEFTDRFKQFALKMLEFDKNIELHFKDKIDSKNKLSPSLALNLFRICQEAFNNCLKHAQCSNIFIEFASTSNCLFLFEIKDDGIGFDKTDAVKKGHYGLNNMELRAQEFGAILTLQSEIDKGTLIKLEYLQPL